MGFQPDALRGLVTGSIPNEVPDPAFQAADVNGDGAMDGVIHRQWRLLPDGSTNTVRVRVEGRGGARLLVDRSPDASRPLLANAPFRWITRRNPPLPWTWSAPGANCVALDRDGTADRASGPLALTNTLWLAVRTHEDQAGWAQLDADGLLTEVGRGGPGFAALGERSDPEREYSRFRITARHDLNGDGLLDVASIHERSGEGTDLLTTTGGVDVYEPGLVAMDGTSSHRLDQRPSWNPKAFPPGTRFPPEAPLDYVPAGQTLFLGYDGVPDIGTLPPRRWAYHALQDQCVPIRIRSEDGWHWGWMSGGLDTISYWIDPHPDVPVTAGAATIPATPPILSAKPAGDWVQLSWNPFFQSVRLEQRSPRADGAWVAIPASGWTRRGEALLPSDNSPVLFRIQVLQ